MITIHRVGFLTQGTRLLGEILCSFVIDNLVSSLM